MWLSNVWLEICAFAERSDWTGVGIGAAGRVRGMSSSDTGSAFGAASRRSTHCSAMESIREVYGRPTDVPHFFRHVAKARLDSSYMAEREQELDSGRFGVGGDTGELLEQWRMGDSDPGKSGRVALLKAVDEMPHAASRVNPERGAVVQHDNRSDMLEVDQVVHDVANLLTSIAARATWLLRRGSTNEQEQSLRIIEQAADDAMHVLRRLQPQALQELHASSTPQQHDVRDLMQSSLEIVRSRWLGRAIIDVDIDLGPHSLWVDGSGVELREAFINVLCNAVDAMPRGGLLRIRSQSANNEIALSISDNGIGMNAEIVGQAFAAYFTTKGDAGSGLGLSVSHRILTKHGGRMTLTSTQGVGTTVNFHLPSCAPR